MDFRQRVRARNQRAKRVERRIKKGIAVALLFGAAAILIGSAGAEDKVVTTEYVVQPGDTLWSIAEHYRELDASDKYILEYKHEILDLNPDLEEKGGQVAPGDVLKIRYRERK